MGGNSEHYVNGVIMQSVRIQRARKIIDKKLRKELDSVKNAPYTFKSRKPDFSLPKLYCDYHFHFVCIGQINKLLGRLEKELQSPDIEAIHTKFEKLFGEDVDLRNDLEHIDERAIGEKCGKSIPPIRDWGYLRRAFFLLPVGNMQ